MKFKLIENFDETRSIVQDYMYDAMDELNNASLEEYIQWFKDNLTAYSEDLEQAVTDAYIEACDYNMIKGVEKTRLTSELKEYIESNTNIIDDTDELMKQCPGHLQHELKIVLSRLDESLTEELLTEESYVKIGLDITKDDGRNIKDYSIYAIVDDTKVAELASNIPNIISSGKFPHESVNKDLCSKLQNCTLNKVTSVEEVTKDDIDPSKLLITTNKALRTASRNNFKKELQNDKNLYSLLSDYQFYIHHPEKNELNTDPKKNVYILYKGSKQYSIILHQLIHQTDVDVRQSNASGSFSLPMIMYNDKTNAYEKKQLSITLNVN